ncbi:MAG TPA: MFS transporter [Candidatus Agrococcus pullicola]|uniref:MFS transporter n=1 Tax=Candidatus Agrococcus pullicola TaxID=2838429 RepID=A0A9D1YXG3_9MICO|nr:MFS transporter [Candidatus Agrococcus pullicola]
MHSSYKWVVLFSAFIIYLFDALEIAILSFALPAVSAEFGLEPVQGGLLATATLLGMGFSGPIMGWLADNKGRKFALNVCLVLFILLTAAIYFVPNFTVFLILRFVAGLGLGGVWSIISAFVVETWPPHQRGKAVAFVLASFPIGGVAAAQLASWMMPHWREMFLVAGLSAILPLLLSIFLLRESEAWREQRALAQVSAEKTNVSLTEIFRPGLARVTIFASLVATAAFVAYYGASTWLPSYLETERGLDAQSVGQFMTWLNLGMFAGYIVFGWLADKIGKKNALLLSMFGSGVLMPLYGIVTDQSVLLWLGPLYAFFMTFAGLFGSYLGELFPTRVRATGAGFTFNVGRGVSAFAPMILGGIAAAASFATGLIVAGLIFLLGGVFLLFLPKAPSDHKNATKTSTLKGVNADA